MPRYWVTQLITCSRRIQVEADSLATAQAKTEGGDVPDVSLCHHCDEQLCIDEMGEVVSVELVNSSNSEGEDDEPQD